MQGKLIVIEGSDGAGKSTQSALLCENLKSLDIKINRLVFPQYSEPSSALIKMYLAGEFGNRPDDVSPYAASTFFALDRYASYKKFWQKNYLEGELFISDRYTTSNAIHQAAKLLPCEREKFLEWLFDFEYGILGLPEPSKVIFLDMPFNYSVKLIKSRNSKETDIHEDDLNYLEKCYESAKDASIKFCWHTINCVVNDKIRSIEEIQKDLLSIIINEIRG